MTPEQAIEAAANIVGRAALARRLKPNVTPGNVSQWISGRRRVPSARCPEIERLTDGQIPVELLRPDLRWHRKPQRSWPHPKGRPLLDVGGRGA